MVVRSVEPVPGPLYGPGSMETSGSTGSPIGDRSDVRRVEREAARLWSAGDTVAFHREIDRLAREAATGSALANEALLTLVHQFGLARPGVATVFGPGADADDAMAAALSAVERRVDRYEGRSAFRTWLYTVARNEALMLLRRKKPTAELSDEMQPMGHMSSIIVNRRSIERAIDELPEPYRTTMTLRQFDELDYEEIAARLDIPVGTVRSRLAKARELLARNLGGT